ncbi:MAG: histidinol-phosphate aminotransferase family protein, partial [Planctomycetes bacterium]|nr:histidinol-phosphate aminotransferase family protein [Planctomycetota bacterium]
RVADCTPYVSPQPPQEIDRGLNSNEGQGAPAALLEALEGRAADLLRRYPQTGALESVIAERFGLSADQVLVSAGADDALYRACLAMLGPQREAILPIPTFEMLDRHVRLAGGSVAETKWLSGPYPTDAVVEATTDRTALIAVVTPNNPTGAVATADDLQRLRAGAPRALLLVDLAYAEFADCDLTQAALALPNALVVRTLSKAWGLAGLRVGFALGRPKVIRWLRSVGNPYAVSSLSAALAAQWLAQGDQAVDAYVQQVRDERIRLSSALRNLGADPLPSQANFVLARFAEARDTWLELARRGIAVRAFPEHPVLKNYLRITCPGQPAAFSRLIEALRPVPGRRAGV